VKLCCPLDGTWSVRFSSAETWTGPDGVTREMVRGRCERCQSVVLTEPSQQAIELAAARLSTAGAMRRVAGDG
jgi:hypothetical protein